MFNSFKLNFKTKFHNKTPKVFCLTFGVHVTTSVALFFVHIVAVQSHLFYLILIRLFTNFLARAHQSDKFCLFLYVASVVSVQIILSIVISCQSHGLFLLQNVLLYGTKTTQPYRNLEETVARLW